MVESTALPGEEAALRAAGAQPEHASSSQSGAPNQQQQTTISASRGFIDFLATNRVSLALTCYQRSAGLSKAATLRLHPFLFAAASVFVLWASNLGQLSSSDVTGALAGSLGAALVLFLAFGAAFRSLGAKAAILASIIIVASLFYQPLVSASRFGGDVSSAAALPIVLAIVGFLIVLVARLRIDLTLGNAVLNGIAFVVFATPAWQVALHEWNAGSRSVFTADTIDEAQADVAARSLPADPSTPRITPDIYYFIFDRYASQPALAEHYGFDNSDLIDFLKAKGFYVASDSHSNYLKTAHSLASTFDMGYLDFLAQDERSKPGEWRPILAMLKDHRVARFLKSAGYKFVQIGAWWGPTQHNPYADENYSFGYGEFDYIYLRRTIIPPILNAVAPTSTYARRQDWDAGQCQRVPRQIDKVKEIAQRGEATFVFTHILLPHTPYVFDPQGGCLSQAENRVRGPRQGYVEQVQYANSLVKDVVSTLLAKDGLKPVIIIQADEGPFPERYEWSNRSWHDATSDELKLKTSILNAYYFSDGDYRDLYQQITPVNTFRILFGKYFHTEFERLPDRIYAFSDNFTIYDFFDITDIVRGSEYPADVSPRGLPLTLP
jgi:hypothetical protein